MRERLKYFVFNKESDFRRGCAYNIAISPEGISIADLQSSDMGTFFSRLLDSREKETVWHRMVVDYTSVGESSIRYTFYSSERRVVDIEGSMVDLGDYLADAGIDAYTKGKNLEAFRMKTALAHGDMLLHEVQGRYCWLRVEFFGQGEDTPRISKIKIYLPKQSWMEYLPEIYQHDVNSKSFVERYLGIFQSLYQDLEYQIDNVTGYFDPDVAQRDFLDWLAQWIQIEDGYIWTEEQLRYLIKNGLRMFKQRGTRDAVSDIVELYTGEKPYIVERYQLDRYIGEAKIAALVSRLYGEDSYMFTIVVNENSVPSVKEYKTLLKIIDTAKPAHMEANVVVLKPYIFLDRYSYLGMNSVLGQYRPVHLDGFSAVPLTSVVDDYRQHEIQDIMEPQ